VSLTTPSNKGIHYMSMFILYYYY